MEPQVLLKAEESEMVGERGHYSATDGSQPAGMEQVGVTLRDFGRG